MTDVHDRAKQARDKEGADITDRELDAIFESESIHVSSLATCSKCGIGGEHRRRRDSLLDQHSEWPRLLRKFRANLEKLNEILEKYELKRQLLCYMDSNQDDSFEKARVFNKLRGEELRTMLDQLRYAAPFIDLQDQNELKNLGITKKERKLAAIIKLIEIREEISIELGTSSEDSDLNEAEVLISAVARSFKGKLEMFDELQAKLPPKLRVAKSNIKSVRKTLEDVSKEENVRGLPVILRGNRDPPNEEEKEKQAVRQRLEKTWGIRDKTGKLWRWRGGRFRRLSVVHKVVRAFNGSVHVHQEVKGEHPPEQVGFVPPLDEHFFNKYKHVL